MSGSVNKAILIGHLGADPKLSTAAATGAKIAVFSLATSKSWRDKATGERKEQTQWHRVVIYNDNLAKVAEQYLKKGAKIYIEGEIAARNYRDNHNVERSITEIVLGSFGAALVMLDRREGTPPPAESEASYGSAKPPIDDEIPF
jgi:single-strand DNA-binding protein